MAKLLKNYVALFIFSGLLLAFGVITLPPLELPVINFILALGLIAYLVLFLFKKLSHARGVMFVVLLVEFVIVSLIAAGLVLQQFKLINISGVCRTVGLALWLHSLGALIAAYHAAYVRSARRTPPYIFALHLAFVSLGVYMFASPFISDLIVTWIVSIASLTFGVLALIFAIIFAARSGKKKKSNKA